MIIDIGNIIVSKIDDLPFLDKYTGVVKTLSKEEVSDNKTIKKYFPASCQATLSECNESRYLDFCPDDSKKSVLFLEDNGVRFKSVDGTKISMVASLDLVCWLNLPKLGVEGCSYSSRAVAAIVSRLIGKGTPFQDGIFQQTFITPIAEKSKTINPFAKYSFDIEKNQFLVYPFDYFVLSLEVSFLVNSKCFDEIVLGPGDNCIKK